MYACRPSLGALSLFPVTHPAVVADSFTRPPPPPPPPTTAVACIVRVVLCVCQRLPLCGMGACGVCIVSGCECSLRVGGVGLPRLVAGCTSVHTWAGPTSTCRGAAVTAYKAYERGLPTWQQLCILWLTCGPPVGH